MPKFRVGFHYTEYGVVTVEADNPESAESVVEAALDADGTSFDSNGSFTNYETTDRDFGAQDAEEVK